MSFHGSDGINKLNSLVDIIDTNSELIDANESLTRQLAVANKRIAELESQLTLQNLSHAQTLAGVATLVHDKDEEIKGLLEALKIFANPNNWFKSYSPYHPHELIRDAMHKWNSDEVDVPWEFAQAALKGE
jgi:hypothetical protein